MSEFDKDLKVGDLLVVTCEKGFFKVEKVEQRFYTQADLDRMGYYHPTVNPTNIKVGDEYTSIIHCRRVAKDNGTPIKHSKRIGAFEPCHVSLAREEKCIPKTIREHNETIVRLKELLQAYHP